MLKLHVKRLGNVAVLLLQGRIVSGDTEVLRNTVQSLSEVGAVKLDLARVTTVDAHGLGVMLELREQLTSSGVQFELTNVSALVKRVFEITRLDSVFQISRSAEFTPAIANVMRAARPMLAA
jgi:anti-sigma B factor antagonist